MDILVIRSSGRALSHTEWRVLHDACNGQFLASKTSDPAGLSEALGILALLVARRDRGVDASGTSRNPSSGLVSTALTGDCDDVDSGADPITWWKTPGIP